MNLIKVPAHQKTAEYTNDLELGLIDGNNAADAAAQAANKTRRPAAWSLWNAYSLQVVQSRTLAVWIRSHMLSVSKIWNQS